MPFEEEFREAFEPWLPTLYDIEKKKADGVAPYTSIGFDKLVINAAATNLVSKQADLNVLFIERYGRRRINAETLEMWQIRLQTRFDEIMSRYERGYIIYGTKATAMMSDISQGSESSSTSQNKQINTPDAVINASDNYADNLSKGSSDVSTVMKGQLVEDVNRNISAFRDLDIELIKEFENLFLNVFWY